MSVRLKNLTPHEVNLILNDGRVVTLPSEGCFRLDEVVLAEETMEVEIDGTTCAVPVVRKRLIIPTQLPPSHSIVSLPALMLLAGKAPDLFLLSPDTGPASVVRDDKGRIVGVKRFCTIEVTSQS